MAQRPQVRWIVRSAVGSFAWRPLTRYTFEWMFELFTERARQVVVLAQEEARTLKHHHVGTEHILLGLLREEEGLAGRVLGSLDITLERVRAQVVRIVGSGEQVNSGHMPFTPHAKEVLELALREALSLGHNYIGTEHILLGLVRENEGVAARILLDFDADCEKIRNEVIRMLSGPGGRRAGAGAGTGDLPTAAANPPAPEASTAQTTFPEVKGLSDDELDKAINRAIDQLSLEEQDFSSRRRALHGTIDVLRAERDRRRRDDD